MNPDKSTTTAPKAVPLQPVPPANHPAGVPPNLSTHSHSVPDAFQKVAAWKHYNATKTPPVSAPSEGFFPLRPPNSLMGLRPQYGGPPPIGYMPFPGFAVHSPFPVHPGIPTHSGFVEPFPPQPVIQEDFKETLVETISSSMSPVATPKISAAPPCNYTLMTTISGHSKSVAVVKFSLCGKYLGTGAADKLIKIWRVHDMQHERTLAGHKLGINDFSWSSNSLFIASASDDTTVKIFDVTSGVCLKTMEGHTNYVFCCSFNPQSSLIASGGYDEFVRVWDVKTGKCIKYFPAHSDPVTSIAFNNDGSLIATSSYEGCIRIWDTSTGACRKTLVDTDRAPITFVNFTPNGKYLMSSQLDSTLKLWDHVKGKPVKYYTGHVNNKYCIFANMSVSQGKLIISGSEDGKVYIWDIQSKEVLQALEGHTSPVLATDSHPTQSLIASGGLEPDNLIRIWRSDK